ncbi:MAG: GlxA family transcriptional regulator [Marinobacterium sp.]|nr:GlxA family transcriptional regulator [Marinobacterium sp.]
MKLNRSTDGVITVSFLLVPEYAMVALLSAIEPLRVANRFAGREVFRWQLLSEDGKPVDASNQLAISRPLALSDTALPENLFICSSFNPEKHLRMETVNWLKKAARNGCKLGAMDTGCYWLAEAGLLKGRQITLHWEAAPAFRERYPDVQLSNELFEIDNGLITCAGGTSALDMMLDIVQTELGHALAVKVCEQFIKSGIRQKSDKQRIDLAARLNVHHPRLLRVINHMENSLEQPLNSSQLAEYACLSVRQLERLFRNHLGHSPSEYYMKLRLNRARQLLRSSGMSVSEVALACGFGSCSHFTRSYKKQFENSPRDDRG